MKCPNPLQGVAAADRLFGLLDTNGDGVVSRFEFATKLDDFHRNLRTEMEAAAAEEAEREKRETR